jgi:hypothetical protein
MEDSNPFFESTCDFIERHKERRRVRAGRCDETTAVFRRSGTQLYETPKGVLIGSAYMAPQPQQSADAERIQAALLAEAKEYFAPLRWLARFWRWVWR